MVIAAVRAGYSKAATAPFTKLKNNKCQKTICPVTTKPQSASIAVAATAREMMMTVRRLSRSLNVPPRKESRKAAKPQVPMYQPSASAEPVN